MSDQSQTGQVDGAGGPLAYFITFTCCGTWLHGQDAGSVDRRHNQPDTSVLPADTARRQENRDRMGQEPYELDSQRRPIVLEAIREVCSYRQWRLLAVHVRSKKSPRLPAQALHGVLRVPEPGRPGPGREREQEHHLRGEDEGRDRHVPGTSPRGSECLSRAWSRGGRSPRK